MNIAPLPDHGRASRPEWQALWMQYEPVTTPLRMVGLVCDIETCGDQTVIYVNLPDGTHLVIADADGLPDRLEQVTGWRIGRSHHDNPNFDALVFDSTEGGEHEGQGADVISMLAAVALHLKTLPDVDTQATGTKLGKVLLASGQRFAVAVTGVNSQHAAYSRMISAPVGSQPEAVKAYSRQTHLLEEDGWKAVHEQGGADWPLTVWQRRDVVVLVFVTRLLLL
ncbi:hypothetical protein ACWELV_24875 [Streptomyces mirabilis]